MKPVEDIKAEEFMNSDPIKAQNDQNLSQIKNKMEENKLRAIPVVDSKDQLEGVIGYRDLIRYIQFNPEKTKLSKVMHQPPKFDMEDSLVEIADLRINSGRKLMVCLNKEKLVGIVSDAELLEALSDTKDMEKVSTEDVDSRDLITVFEQDKLDEARHAMLDSNISRVPVLDKNGKLSGIVRSTDMLKTMVPRQVQSSGGRAGNREGSEVKISGGSEKERISDIPVKEMMDGSVNTSDRHLSGKEAVDQMREEGQDEIVILKDGYPNSIVTLKDLIDFIEGFAPGKTVLVNLTGLDVDQEKSLVHRKIRKQLQGSLGRKLKRPEELTVNVKKAEKDGNRHRYELNMKLYSELGQIAIDEEGWELQDTVDECLNQMNEVVRRKSDKRKEHN